MAYSDDAAEQVVKIALEGTEVAARITGESAKQIAILLYAVMKEQKRTMGKARLTTMLRSGKELRVFAVRDQDLEVFCRQAKTYGILYSVLKDRDANDGLTEIMVYADQAGQVNRIFERHNLTTVDMASVRNEIAHAVQERPQEEAPELERPGERSKELDTFLDELLGKPDRERNEPERPMTARAETDSPSAPPSEMPGNTDERLSIRKELQEIRADLAAKHDLPHSTPEKIHLKPKER